jgi:hypothetical protein
MIAVFRPAHSALREGGLSNLDIVGAATSPLPACGERSDRVSDPGEGDFRRVQTRRLFPEILHRHGSPRVPLTRPRFARSTSPRKRGEVRARHSLARWDPAAAALRPGHERTTSPRSPDAAQRVAKRNGAPQSRGPTVRCVLNLARAGGWLARRSPGRAGHVVSEPTPPADSGCSSNRVR